MANFDIIGDVIKNIRKSKNLTLQQMSDLTGISIGQLSNLERNTSNPSLESIHKICNVLDITINDLLLATDEDTIVIRKNDRAIVYDDETQFRYESLNYGSGKMNGLYININPTNLPCDKSWSHKRDEMGIVIKGKIDVIVDEVVYTLDEGDSIYIDAGKKHSFVNTYDDLCITYWVYKDK